MKVSAGLEILAIWLSLSSVRIIGMYNHTHHVHFSREGQFFKFFSIHNPNKIKLEQPGTSGAFL